MAADTKIFNVPKLTRRDRRCLEKKQKQKTKRKSRNENVAATLREIKYGWNLFVKKFRSFFVTTFSLLEISPAEPFVKNQRIVTANEKMSQCVSSYIGVTSPIWFQ